MSLSGFRARNHAQQVAKRGALEKVDDRRTPDSLWTALHAEFRFTMDAAATAENTKRPIYCSPEDDGLACEWFGSVWCNPPYSDCGAWVRKAHLEWHRTRPDPLDCIVMLLPANRTEQRWWQEEVEPYRRDRGGGLEVRFLAGRLRFDVPPGTYSDPRGNRPPFGCCLLVWQRAVTSGITTA